MTTIDTTLAEYDVATTCDTTIARFDVITPGGGGAAKYRDRGAARIVALRNRAGRLTNINVVVTVAGHMGSFPLSTFSYSSSHTLEDFAEGRGNLLGAIFYADLAALESLIKSARDAHTLHRGEITDYTAVRDTVAAALGEEPHPGIPVTNSGAYDWLSGFDVPDFIQIVPA